MQTNINIKPLNRKSYGSIPHLPGSRVGPMDYHITEGQAIIATVKKRDKNDFIIVQEKLDGANVGVAKVKGRILAITRAGYLAENSQFIQHQYFAKWVKWNEDRFYDLLNEGERVCGEWLAMAHGTIYNLPHEPFVAFDLITGIERVCFNEFSDRCKDFIKPTIISIGDPLSVKEMMKKIEVSGHGAIDKVEGAIWRIERHGKVDFLTKYVRHDKIDGKYLDLKNNGEAVWNIDISPYLED